MWLNEIVVVVAQIDELPGLPDLSQLIGLGVIGPAMWFSYRLTSRANDQSRTEAWKSNARLEAENARLREENDRLLARLRGRDTGPHKLTTDE